MTIDGIGGGLSGTQAVLSSTFGRQSTQAPENSPQEEATESAVERAAEAQASAASGDAAAKIQGKGNILSTVV